MNTMNTTKSITESSLTRVWQHMSKHDCATLSAFRYGPDCGSPEDANAVKQKYTLKQNLQRNASLLSKIQSSGRFSTTSIKGAYIENFGSKAAREVEENTFFVADIEDKGNLLEIVKKLGEEFEQDSVLFIPKGGTTAQLHGTNHCPLGYPGYGNIEPFSTRELGHKGPFFSRVDNRPFRFIPEIVMNENFGPNDYHGKWACYVAANKHWSKFDV